ncbi:MarR family winged helix-turn-helix transcriptional regulator [Saccharopolyspora phatthalungensis]|uniref:DNA-binding MarR family transcriptional regulator n=1 Tax=Saccharopolyspora phatthalungensis TaxID=664693 RepID=A0A840Q2A3_9PSEU|nr:MarR family transcriptional regulator [Saccharopolyspora phatthalungensis]MBB5154127.1 DNA-binding MarR family transcriptional regulator [Saccharopolyspora phatthalungensis]
MPGFLEQDPQRMPLSRLVGLTGRRLSHYWEQAVARSTDLSRTAMIALTAIDEQDGQTHREVAQRCWVRPATLTPVIDALESDKLLTRQRDTTDRRVVRLRITPAGRAALKAAWQGVREEFRRIEPDASPAEEALIRKYLLAVLSGLNEKEGGCDHCG